MTNSGADTMSVILTRPSPPPAVGLTVIARAKDEKLMPEQPIKIVKSVTTDGEITKLKTDCYSHGNKLTGKHQRAVCSVKIAKTKVTYSNAKIKVIPKYSVDLKLRTKSVAYATGKIKAK
jgi:hypothetical protein